MKKLLPLLIIAIITLSTIGITAIPINKTKQEKITNNFSQLSEHKIGEYITLNLEGTNSVLMKKNHYMLPSHINTLTFPLGTKITNIKCKPMNIHEQTLNNELMIAPEPIRLDENYLTEEIQEKDPPISIDTWYEYDIGVGIHKNERCVILKIQTYPVQYYPLKNTIEWTENIEIIIEYEENISPIVATNNEQYNLLVISPTDYRYLLYDLMEHKNNRNIPTKLVTLDEIYSSSFFPVEGRDDPEKIKYFIKNAIENWNINNVLLIGGSSLLPVRKSNVDDLTFASDLYYADIYNDTFKFCTWDSNDNDEFGEYKKDDVDLYPDVFIGRLACVNTNEVSAVVDKIITYETNKAYEKEWFTNIVLVGGDSFTNDPHYGDDSGVNEGEVVNQVVIDIMDGFVPNKIWDSNGRISGVSPSGVTEISNAINDGCGFIDFSGHGNTFVYATHPHNSSRSVWVPTPTKGYKNTHAANLENGNKLPIMIIGACSVGKYDQDPDCFSWSFVSNPNGGSIASFGATTLGYAYVGESVTEGLIEGMSINVFEAYRDGAVTFGELWLKGIENYIYPRMRESDYLTIEEWQPFGDPTLAIRGESLAPSKPYKPEGKTSGGTNVQYTYTTSTTDPEGDQIYYLFDWGDGTTTGYIGPFNSGETIQASHQWEEKGNYQIKVKAKDEHGVQSEWSDPLSISMPKNKQLIDFSFYDYLEGFPILFKFLKLISFLFNQL